MTDAVMTPLERAQSLEALVRDNADAADEARRLPAIVAEAFAANGLYRIGAPVGFGGEAADPMTQVETIEAIACFDGAAGWNLMIGIELFGLVTPGCGGCRELFEDPMAVLSGSTAAVGRADRDGEGYRVNGQWQFVSGCHNSSIFGATVICYDNDKPLPGSSYALIEAPDYTIIDTWHVGGMRGSGSHDVKVEDVWIPETRMVAPLGGTVSDEPLLRFPLGSRLAYNKVGVSIGLARAALDAFVALAEGKMPRFSSRSLKDRPSAHRAIAEAEVRLLSARALVKQQVEYFWDLVQRDAHISTRERAIFQLACSDAVRASVECVDRVADAAGTSANFQGHPLERISRDVRVVRQHATVAGHHMDDAGRVLLGLPPEGVMLAGL
jgi:alkylation response protein AidB-like acyl-CoA dehydrogenase